MNLLQFVEVLFCLESSKKRCVVLSLTSFGTLKYDCVKKTIEILRFQPLINNSVSIGFSLLLLIISAIISSKTINILRFFLDCTIQYFYKHVSCYLSIQ